jgi:hypothetical protein
MSRPAHPGVEDRVVRLHLVAVHERHDRDRRRVVRRRVVHDDQGLVVRVRAVGVPPGPLDGPARERGGPGVRGGQRVPGRLRDGVEGAADGAERLMGRRAGLAGGSGARRGWLGRRLGTRRVELRGSCVGHDLEDSTGGRDLPDGAPDGRPGATLDERRICSPTASGARRPIAKTTG